MMNVLHSILSLITWYFRPLVKWFLNKTTRLCELQRLCYGEKAGAPRDLGVENSLLSSRSPDIKNMVILLDRISDGKKFTRKMIQFAVYTVLRVKNINPKFHPQFGKSFAKCIEHIWGYRQLVQEVESLRTTPYDTDNQEHEEKLMTLWQLLMPSVQLESRVTKQWQEIGFQGDDPKTDFRGMGILGLDNLIYFAQEYPGPASHVLSHSHHPQYGYAFAIVGINLTSMAYHLFKDGSAKTHVYNVSKQFPSMKIFHQFYCYLFYEFDRFWIEAKPRNVMDFSYIREKFENRIRICLANPNSVFRINIAIDNI